MIACRPAASKMRTTMFALRSHHDLIWLKFKKESHALTCYFIELCLILTKGHALYPLPWSKVRVFVHVYMYT